MTAILKTARDVLLRTLYFSLQNGMTAYRWLLRFFKIRLHNWKKCGAQKALDRELKQLGTGIYSLYARDEGDWQNAPSVQQQIRAVKEAEGKLLQADALREAIDADYAEKKEKIREKYAARKAAIGPEGE
ncbi:MAG: hypothetical protein GX422_11425 [Deltaproteobacteria bacterium]|nr:hypothetical protein [Deltaproteobacteria bacterium]